MINKVYTLSLLFEMRDKGIDVEDDIKYMMAHSEPSLDIIAKINGNLNLNLRGFYEKLRRSYNSSRSKLYINIVKETDLEPKEIICTLSSLLLQIMLYNKNIDDPYFLESARLNEIIKCIDIFYKRGDIVPSQELLRLVKADLKFLEETSSYKRDNLS